LHIDPERETDRARRSFESHLSRAKWMTGLRRSSALLCDPHCRCLPTS
jgi:hypothetical protein